MSQEREIERSQFWKLMCDGESHWIVPIEKASVIVCPPRTRIEAGGCICAPEPGEVGKGLKELADTLEGPSPFKGEEG